MQTPLRRSQRGQPVVSDHVSQNSENTATTKAGDVVYTRALDPADLTGDQFETLQTSEVDFNGLQTRFHNNFTRGDLLKRATRVYGKRKPVAQIDSDIYNVGDTVLVETQAKDSSIAVITGVWSVEEGDRVLYSNVSLHWFLRPKELPKVRVKHTHEEEEIYYTLSRSVVAPSTIILERCLVSSNRTAVSPLAMKSFFCLHAIDSQKGIYYDFLWEEHRREAMASANFWETTRQWDVTALNLPETPQKNESVVSMRGRHRSRALPDLPEEDEPDDPEERDEEPPSPSKKKRKRASQGTSSPAKRARVFVGKVAGEVGDTKGSTSHDALHLVDNPDQAHAVVAIPQTPSRRGRKKAEESPYPNPRQKLIQLNSVKPLRSMINNDPNSEDENLGEFYHSTALKSSTEPTTPSRRRRGKARAKLVEITSDDETGDPDYSAPPGPDDSAEQEDEHEPEDIEAVPKTPSRRNRSSATSTPRKKRTTIAAPTPHSKAALRARAKRKRTLAVRPPPPDSAGDLQLQLQNIPDDPWLRAMHVLHVSARPDAHILPCREEEYARVLRAVEELLEEGSGGCIYISGVPGTGKTATVHTVVRELKRMAEQNETSPFTYVEINGLRIPEPSTAYNLLWEAVSGHDASREGHMKISTKESLKQLTKHFGQGERFGPGGHACVVLMDELDQLMTSKQDVVYNFFNWPTLVGSKLIVLAVANTMDLPERVMSGRVRSRLGMVRINFQPYTTPQLEKIVRSRLHSARECLSADAPDVIAPDGIKFAAMKVSSISGDARRVLDICRRAVELVHPQSRTARTDDVKKVIVDMQNSPTAAYLRDLSFHERLMLAALLRCIKREGVEEIAWGDVQRQHLLHINVLAEEEDTTRRPTPGELGIVLDSLAASRAVLCEDGALLLRKSEDDKRIVMNLEHAEVERVLGEVGGTKWKNALNI